MWRVVRRAPFVFVLIPAALWFPTDLVLEILTRDHAESYWSQVQAYHRLAQVAQLVIGTLVASIFLAALLDLGAGRPVVPGRAFQQGLAMWPTIFGVALLVAIRLVAGVLLLIVPGLYLALRYALSTPAAAFEGRTGVRALEASVRDMKGQYWRLALGVSAAALLYLPLGYGPILLVPGNAGNWPAAAANLPLSVLSSYFTIALTLIYADRRGGDSLLAPVGRDQGPEETGSPVAESGRRGVLVTAVASIVVLLLTGYLWFTFLYWPYEAGARAWEEEEWSEALRHYRRAAVWDPQNVELLYGIAWSHTMLDEYSEAEAHFARAVELEPERADFRYGHANVLVNLGDFPRALEELQAAREAGYSDMEALEELEDFIRRNASTAPSESSEPD